MGEYFLVIIFCMFGECQNLDSPKAFASYGECHEQAQATAMLFNKQYPNSTGEIYCLTEDEYNKYIDTTEPKEAPKIGNPV
jgi:hypothetical protein